MRKKSEARRSQILKTATKLFLSKGYERTSMDELTIKLGYSKATIYNYFPSKKELFANAINDVVSTNARKIFSVLTKLKSNQEQFWPSLEALATGYLKLQLSTEVLGITRIAISEGERMSLGDILYQYGPSKGWTEVADCFQDAMNCNILRQADPMRAAMHFKGLLEADILDKRLRTLLYKVTDEQIEEVVSSAIDVFKRAYQA
jgi:AcrR family transcriptional regulator